jgi:hypothetical protein
MLCRPWLQELHGLLTANCMIRRLKTEVLTQLPPKRRMTVLLEAKDGLSATARRQQGC